MHILLTNDDGYQAKGLAVLAACLQARGHRVSIAAPDREQSATSHSLSIHPPLRVREIRVEGVCGKAIDGTPADCARLGLFLLKEDWPDLTISGINCGPNLGAACIYSGTVNAAIEASMAGCPAMAVSLNSYDRSSDYVPAAELAERLAVWMCDHPLDRGQIYNLNVPCAPEIRGLRFTRKMAPEYVTDPLYQAFDSNKNVRYYVLDDSQNSTPYPPDSDAVLCAQGWATLSALGWDLTVKQTVLPEGEITL